MLKLACHNRLKNWRFFLSSNVISELTMQKLWKLRQAYQKLRSVAKSDFNSFWSDQFRIFLFLPKWVTAPDRNIVCSWFVGVHCIIRELKQRRRGRQRERQKSNRFILAKQQLCTCITLFLYISLPSLPDYNGKMPEFTFCRGREHKTTTFFSFPELRYTPLEFNSKNICQHLTK